MHKPTTIGEQANPFVNSLRNYTFPGGSPMASRTRGGSLSPRAKDFFSSTMTTFSKQYKKQMSGLHEYQKRMDERLSAPKRRVKLFKKI